MDRPHWKPLPADLRDATSELARYLRSMLDRNGLSLRKLAADEEVHYSLTTLHRYFSGRALPPWRLTERVSRRCGGDPREAFELYERARREVEPDISPVNPVAGNLQLRVDVTECDADLDAPVNGDEKGLSASIPLDPATGRLSLRLTFHFDGGPGRASWVLG